MQGLGIKNLLISNVAGAINLKYKKGDLMLIEDHINLQGLYYIPYSGKDIELGFHGDENFPKSFIQQELYPLGKKTR